MSSLPKHIAIIMDGNGRWSKKRFMPRNVGHLMGASNLRGIVRACVEKHIQHLTVFAFSTENWRRPPEEVATLFDLFVRYLKSEIRDLQAQGIRLKVIGDHSAFPKELQDQIDSACALTAQGRVLTLTVAINYGGKWDILQAMQAWQRAHPYDSLDQMTQDQLTPYLSTYPLPEPDLLIRTGGESRLSNFLIWQTAYTELYFTDLLWPDFDARALQLALDSYAQRIRRFGKTDDQVKATHAKTHKQGVKTP
ncbi:MAG: polyprenyl diphosphate synthase [Betaproteobacteria bacterium]|jgi:undecaprenyl diphosphate synthase